jgi:ParB-like chromosome segregation protein Spo0J
MRLLNLPIEAKRALVEERDYEGHARVILSIFEPDKQLELLDLMIKNHWTVRQAEEYARGLRGRRGRTKRLRHGLRRRTSSLWTSVKFWGPR